MCHRSCEVLWNVNEILYALELRFMYLQIYLHVKFDAILNTILYYMTLYDVIHGCYMKHKNLNAWLLHDHYMQSHDIPSITWLYIINYMPPKTMLMRGQVPHSHWHSLSRPLQRSTGSSSCQSLTLDAGPQQLLNSSVVPILPGRVSILVSEILSKRMLVASFALGSAQNVINNATVQSSAWAIWMGSLGSMLESSSSWSSK